MASATGVDGNTTTKDLQMLTIHDLITIRHLIRKVYDKSHEEQIVQLVAKIEQEIIKQRLGGQK